MYNYYIIWYNCYVMVYKITKREENEAILSNVAFLHILCFWPSNLQSLG